MDDDPFTNRQYGSFEEHLLPLPSKQEVRMARRKTLPLTSSLAPGTGDPDSSEPSPNVLRLGMRKSIVEILPSTSIACTTSCVQTSLNHLHIEHQYAYIRFTTYTRSSVQPRWLGKQKRGQTMDTNIAR